MPTLNKKFREKSYERGIPARLKKLWKRLKNKYI